MTVAHILEIPGKRQMSGGEWLTVQQTFYDGFAIVGGIVEVGGLLTSLGLIAIERRRRARVWLPVVSTIGFAGMLGAY